jgi:hypothetical protein
MDEHDIRLDKVQRLVAEAEWRVVRQKALVGEARRLGLPAETTEQHLTFLENALDAMRENLKAHAECLLHVQLGKWFRTLRR